MAADLRSELTRVWSVDFETRTRPSCWMAVHIGSYVFRVLRAVEGDSGARA